MNAKPLCPKCFVSYTTKDIGSHIARCTCVPSSAKLQQMEEEVGRRKLQRKEQRDKVDSVKLNAALSIVQKQVGCEHVFIRPNSSVPHCKHCGVISGTWAEIDADDINTTSSEGSDPDYEEEEDEEDDDDEEEQSFLAEEESDPQMSLVEAFRLDASEHLKAALLSKEGKALVSEVVNTHLKSVLHRKVARVLKMVQAHTERMKRKASEVAKSVKKTRREDPSSN